MIPSAQPEPTRAASLTAPDAKHRRHGSMRQFDRPDDFDLDIRLELAGGAGVMIPIPQRIRADHSRPDNGPCQTDPGSTCQTCETNCRQATCQTCHGHTCETCQEKTCHTCQTCATCAGPGCEPTFAQTHCYTCRSGCGHITIDCRTVACDPGVGDTAECGTLACGRVGQY